jgi:hypothetical protein
MAVNLPPTASTESDGLNCVSLLRSPYNIHFERK